MNKHINYTNTYIIKTEGTSEAEYLKKIFSNNLNHYMNIYDKSIVNISTDLKIKYSTVRDWCNGTNYPRIDKIQRLANYFNISKSDLTEINTKIRVFDRIPAHKPINLINGDIGTEELPQYWFKEGKKFFGFVISDDTMYNDYQKRRYGYI